MGLSANTRLPAGGPKFNLVGPTVDDDIRRAILLYGVEAVKEAVKRQARPKRGRKPLDDWPELGAAIEADARVWLAGGDPFSTRSNYSIAKDFADHNPGQSHPAVMQRIERKLDQQRVLRTLIAAQHISWEESPHAVHIRALEAVTKLGARLPFALDRARSDLADYEAKKGEPPPAHLPMKEVEAAARELLPLSLLGAPMKPRGLFGSR